jgi:lipopolysaccharide export system protein LptA
MKMEMAIFLAWVVSAVCAAQPVVKQGSTIITSEELEMNFKPTRLFIYTGQVKVVDPEIDLLCDKMTVTFGVQRKQKVRTKNHVIQPKLNPPNKPAKPPMISQGGKIDVIVAENNVVIINKKDNTRATGEKGVYTAVTNLLVLTGKPVLYHEGGEIRGEVIAWDRITGQLKVTKARVDFSEKKKSAPPLPAPKP